MKIHNLIKVPFQAKTAFIVGDLILLLDTQFRDNGSYYVRIFLTLFVINLLRYFQTNIYLELHVKILFGASCFTKSFKDFSYYFVWDTNVTPCITFFVLEQFNPKLDYGSRVFSEIKTSVHIMLVRVINIACYSFERWT